MATVDLTAQRLRELLHYDPETGVFTRKHPRRGGRDGAHGVGWIDGRYLRLSVDCRKHWAHRLAWLWMTGEWPTASIDHKDGGGTNNKWSNLRDVSTATNVQNVRGPSKGSVSGYLGVERTASGTYQARIAALGVRINLGTYPTPEEASAAYIGAKRRLHQGCTI